MSVGDIFADTKRNKLENFIDQADDAIKSDLTVNQKMLKEIRAIRQALVVIAFNTRRKK